VIFLDISMPLLNGFEFLEEYGKLNINKNGVKIFMLTSSLDPSDEKRASENKYLTSYIQKPLTMQVLDKLLYDNNEAKSA